MNSKCDRCGSLYKLRINKQIYLRCSFSWCRKEKSILSETFLYKSKLSIILKMKIILFWLQGLKFKKISVILNVNKNSIIKVIYKIGKDYHEKYLNSLQKIGGENIIVEIDETKIGKRKYNRGHPVQGVWVLGMVERTLNRKIILVQIEKRNATTLQSIIFNYVKPGSIIYTDCWRGYIGLNRLGYIHLTVNHSAHFVDPVTNVHTNTIEGDWSALKRTIPYRNRTKKLINLWLYRFMILRNEQEPSNYIFSSIFTN